MTASHAQSIMNPRTLRIGDITHDYTTYTQLLSNPTIIYDRPGCEVTNFTISLIPQGEDWIGPYRTTGNELTPRVKNILEGLRGKHTRIAIDSIRVNCNGKNNLLGAMLFYYCK